MKFTAFLKVTGFLALLCACGCSGSSNPQPVTAPSKSSTQPASSAGTIRGFVVYKDPSVKFDPQFSVAVLAATREARQASEKGEVVFDNVVPGQHKMFAFKPGDNLFSALTDVEVEPQKEKKVSLTLKETGSVSGKIRKIFSDETIKPAASILMMASAGLTFYTHTDEKGFFMFPLLPSDTYHITPLPEEYELKGETSLLVEPDKTQALDLAIKPKEKEEKETAPPSFSFSGKLFDASTGKPVSKAKVSVAGKEDISDDQGIFKFASLSSIPYDIRIEAEAYLPVALNHFVPSSQVESVEVLLVPEKDKKNVTLTVVTDKEKYAKEDKILITVKIKNAAKFSAPLYFTSTKIFEVKILAGDMAKWTSTSDKEYVPLFFKMILAPGKELVFKTTVSTSQLAVGSYQAFAEVFSPVAAAPEKPAAFEILEKIEEKSAPDKKEKKENKEDKANKV